MKPLEQYEKKRNFKITNEPKAVLRARKFKALKFVVQEHHASHLHYDFRLEIDGVLKSWAIPKGPSLDPKVRRLAIEVEDHPLDYAKFEGRIPDHQYGAGQVYIWDAGKWVPETDPEKSYADGHIAFELVGKRLKGRWVLLRSKNKQWLLIKRSDEYATTGQSVDTFTAKREPQQKKSSKAKQKKSLKATRARHH
jgi:bifunctional non-homologous end joining protein LigD